MIAVAVVAALLALVAAWMWVMHNRMVRVRNGVEVAWAQIDVQLTRRHDLIPNLIEMVRGYVGHERAALEAVSEARANASAARVPGQRSRAEQDLSGALHKLLAISEAYPELQANRSFSALQTELVSSENLITDSRSVYNDAVQDFNTMIQRVPMNLMAQTMGFTEREYYDVGADRQGPGEVQF